MKTLVYLGANQGSSLLSLYDKFDVVYAFEPNPDVFEELSRRFGKFQHVHLMNFACGEKEGEATFYIAPNKVSSSLEIKVNVVNLNTFLKDHEVKHIDLYYSDIQGADLNVLRTIKSYIDDKKIGELFIETHRDGVVLYEGLDNQLSGFKEILSDNYEWVHASCDGTIVSPDNIPADELEWDCYWKVK